MQHEISGNSAQNTGIAPISAASGLLTPKSFEQAMEMIGFLSTSSALPEQFTTFGGKTTKEVAVANCMIAMDMSVRLGAPFFMVTQNMDIIHGRPSLRATFIAAMINGSGLLSSPLDIEIKSLGEKTINVVEWYGPKENRQSKTVPLKVEDRTFQAIAKMKDGSVVRGPIVTIGMAIDEGWYTKSGSKWKTMPDLMGSYRAISFLSRVSFSHITMGLYTPEEIREMEMSDFEDVTEAVSARALPISGAEAQPITVDLGRKKPAAEPKPVKEEVKTEAPAVTAVVEEAPAVAEEDEVVVSIVAKEDVELGISMLKCIPLVSSRRLFVKSNNLTRKRSLQQKPDFNIETWRDLDWEALANNARIQKMLEEA